MTRTLWTTCLLLHACTGKDPESDSTEPSDGSTQDSTLVTEAPDPVPPGPGDLLIAELYYSGARPSGGADHYFSDQFVELVNTTELPLDLSGVLIGDVHGISGAINPGSQPDSFLESHPDDVVLSSVWKVPEGVEVPPLGTLVIAHDGTNHRPFSDLDLSNAALETWVRGGNDLDHPTVDNLERVVFNGGHDWLITVFGPGVVVLSAGTELGTEEGPYGQELAVAPADAVLDGVEALMDADSGAFKRLPDSVDAGHTWVGGTYVGQSIHRKHGPDGWQDTNDSGADFEVGTPDPGAPPDSAEVWGDPWIELGTGITAFQPLADGDALPLVEGLQGGWHLDAALRFDGFGPAGVVLTYEALSLDATPVSYLTHTTLHEGSVLPGDDGFERLGDRVVLDIAAADEVLDLDLVVRVTAELDGQTWSDERQVRVVAD